jgi:hypothetical protein
MRKVSNAELKRQITREGKRWGLVPMESVFGDVLVAEEIPCVLPLSPGIFVIERVQRDITAVSMDYPFSCLLRNRKKKAERTASLRQEIKEVAYQTGIAQRLDDIHGEMASDIKQADKGRIMVVNGLNTRTG